MQKITTANYYEVVKNIDWGNMPGKLREGHQLVEDLHTPGKHDFNLYSLDADIKGTVDLYFESLSSHLKQETKTPVHSKDKKAVHQKKQNGNKKAVVQKPEKGKVRNPVDNGIDYSERIPDEVRFIKRYINLNRKVKTKDDILRFINSLQKAILEKRIRKSSEYAAEIEEIQNNLVGNYNEMRGKRAYLISEADINRFREKINEQKVWPSVLYLNRFRNIIGKVGIKKKAKLLCGQMERAVKSGKISKKDPYAKQLEMVYDKLQNFISNSISASFLISQQELKGLDGILGCGCPPPIDGLDGFDGAVDGRPQIMNSLDFVKMQFETLGFTGKWLEFIGDPTGNFTAMVFGKPKFGKSFLCIGFAGYLARYHGNVLYVAKEETLDYTLQEKLKDKNVAHENLTVASVMPTDISPFDFIFLDSVNKLGYSPEDLNRLRSLNPDKSFVFIFQTTKSGNFRGANTFQHDVDIVIEVPEWGLATQMGRFNQGGTMRIFE